MIFINKNIRNMRIVVNESQYNKLLLEEHLFYNSVKKWANYITDLVFPHILSLEIDEDVFTYKNLSKKLKGRNFFKKLPIDSIIVNIMKTINTDNNTSINIFYNPYWTTIVSDNKNNDYIIDAEFDIEVSLPEDMELDEMVNINKKISYLLVEELMNLYSWWNKAQSETNVIDLKEQLNIDQLGTEEISDDEMKKLELLNYEFETLLGKPITVKKVNSDGSINIENNLTNEDMVKLKGQYDKYETTYKDIKLSDADTLQVATLNANTFDDVSLFIPANLTVFGVETDISSEEETIVHEPIEVDSDSFYAIPTYWHPIMSLVSKGESGDNYNIKYPGTEVDGLIDMTIKEVDEMDGDPAMGRWQLKDALKKAKKAGIDINEKFSPTNQDKIAMDLVLRKKGITKDMIKNNPTQAALLLAQEWAVMPVLAATVGRYQDIVRGQGYYAGDNINKTTITPGQVEQAFKQMGSSTKEEIKEECKFRVKNGKKISNVDFKDLVPDSNMGGEATGLNFHQIPDGKTNFRSGAPSAEQMLYLLQNNDIKNIVSFDDGKGGIGMSNEEEEEFINCYNKINGTNIKWTSTSAHKGGKYGKGYMGTLNNVLPIEDNTLIHCTHGADRTGYVVASHLKSLGLGGDNEKLWNYTIKYNNWKNVICNGSIGYIAYLEGFYPFSEFCAVGDRMENCKNCKNQDKLKKFKYYK